MRYLTYRAGVACFRNPGLAVQETSFFLELGDAIYPPVSAKESVGLQGGRGAGERPWLAQSIWLAWVPR